MVSFCLSKLTEFKKCILQFIVLVHFQHFTCMSLIIVLNPDYRYFSNDKDTFQLQIKLM